jgi:mannose-1-phosphate guanylyltransferase
LASDSETRCAIVLAGGEGKRLQPLVQKLFGDVLPKQYVNFIGSGSLLEQSFKRAEMLVPRERIFTVVGRDHLRHSAVRRQLAARPAETIVFQPKNCDTAPGVLLPLMALYKKHPRSTVVIFPSDHFVLEEPLFMRHVKAAFSVVEQEPTRMVVLGVQPTAAESEFGYIVPRRDDPASSAGFLWPVKQFVEKPDQRAAEELIRSGGLWNTMVVVANTRRLIGLIRRALPDLHQSFRAIYQALWTPKEPRVLEEVYRELRPVNFSKEFLQLLPSKFPAVLSALPVRGVFWSDMGLPRYVESAQRKVADRLPKTPAHAAFAFANSRVWTSEPLR